METFTPGSALLGGVLIGLSATWLMLALGRVAGISGIAGGALRPAPGEAGWRLAFLAGLIAAPLLWAGLAGGMEPITVTHSLPLLVVGGLLVGFGSRLGGGCTSGHGVVGLARLSPRSMAATAAFMLAALATVFVARHVLGLA